MIELPRNIPLELQRAENLIAFADKQRLRNRKHKTMSHDGYLAWLDAKAERERVTGNKE